MGLLVGRSPPGFLDDWWREDVESTITEGAEPRRGMEVWMGDFMRVADGGLEPGGVVSESEDFCAVCVGRLLDGNSWADWFRGNVKRSLYSSTLSGDKDTIIFGPGCGVGERLPEDPESNDAARGLDGGGERLAMAG